MNIIQKQPNPSGAYPPIQSWSGANAPDGYYKVADGVELICGGFGELIIENDIVIGFAPNTEAWEAWQVEHPTPEPTLDDITALQLAVAEMAETQANDQTANELALAELAEMIGG